MSEIISACSFSVLIVLFSIVILVIVLDINTEGIKEILKILLHKKDKENE